MAKANQIPESTALRRQAASLLNPTSAATEDLAGMAPQEIARLVHELRVHQMELQVQNDELRRIQVELERARDRYEHLYDFAPAAYFTVTEKGTVAAANVTAATLLGAQRKALVGRMFSRFIQPEDQGVWYLHRKSLLETGDFQSFQLRLVKNDGGQLYVNLECTRDEDSDSGLKQIRIVAVDITERKRGEEALRNSEAKMMSIFRAAPIGIGVVSNRAFQDVNDRLCELTGYSRDELVGESSRVLYSTDEDYEYVGTEKYRQIEESGTGTVETRFQRKDGKVIDVLLSSTPIDPNDVSLGITFTALDITERKQAEQILKQYHKGLEQEVACRTAEIEAKNAELQELYAITRQLSAKTIEAMESDRRALSKEIHDSIAGTLAAIKMQLEAHVAHSSQDLSPELMPLETIVGHLTQAIQETRSISSQLRSTTLDDFGLKPALVEHIEHFKQFYPGIEVVFEIEIASKGIATQTQTVLYRVIQEALNNVGKHSAATMVRVKLTKNQTQIGLEVVDNGCGFDLQNVLPGGRSLMGYGIHSIRERVEICGGEFQIRSEPGKGTVIDISIPI
jgi:PAS domain S-box-containing protein